MRDVTATQDTITGIGREVVGVPDLAELADASRRLETVPASSAIRWAHQRFGSGIVLAASFQDCVLVDLAVNEIPDIEVAFLDTQYHFAETLWFVEQVRCRYDLNLNVVKPKTALDDMWHSDPDACCATRKVEPLNRALDGKAAWMSGVRRVETPARAQTPIVSWDLGRGLVKINPIASWTDADVRGYVRDRDLPVHPLAERGYASIGCWPCTRPVTEDENARDGRWSGSDKIECGLH